MLFQRRQTRTRTLFLRIPSFPLPFSPLSPAFTPPRLFMLFFIRPRPPTALRLIPHPFSFFVRVLPPPQAEREFHAHSGAFAEALARERTLRVEARDKLDPLLVGGAPLRSPSSSSSPSCPFSLRFSLHQMGWDEGENSPRLPLLLDDVVFVLQFMLTACQWPHVPSRE